MSNYGSLIGLAAEKDGKRKAAQGPTIEDHSWMNTIRNQENTNGQTGEFRPTSRRV